MLILTRRVGESLKIGGEVTVTVLAVKGNQVRIVELPLFGRTCCGLQITADELAGRLQAQGFVRMNLVVIFEPVGQL